MTFCISEITLFLAFVLLKATYVEHTNLAVHTELVLTDTTGILGLTCSMFDSAHVKAGTSEVVQVHFTIHKPLFHYS